MDERVTEEEKWAEDYVNRNCDYECGYECKKAYIAGWRHAQLVARRAGEGESDEGWQRLTIS